MKIGINKFYDADAKDATGGPALTTEVLMKELTTIKGALEKSLNDKAETREKNLDEKITAVNEAITELKAQKPEVTADELKAIKNDLDITVKAFDLLQKQTKADKQRNTGGNQSREDNSLVGQIVKGLNERKDEVMSGEIVNKKGKDAIQMKAVGDMTTTTTLNGAIPNTYRSGIVPVPFEMVHMRDIVGVIPSETDSYHFYRHTVGEGTIEFQKYESEQKAQIDEDLVETTVNLNYLAGWLRISKKMLRNFTALQAYITKWLPEKYYQREDTKAYQALISGATGVANADTGGGMARQIIRTIGAQRKARYNVNGIVLDGAAWANLLTYTTTAGEYNQPGVVTITPSGQMLIVGIPVYVVSWVGTDEAIVGDWRYFEIIQSEALSLGFFEQDGDNVKFNKVTVRIEASVGFALLDPAAFAVISLEGVS